MLEVLNEARLCAKIGTSPTNLGRMIRAGEFPPPLQVSPRRKGWSSEVIDEWIRTRPVAAIAPPARAA